MLRVLHAGALSEPAHGVLDQVVDENHAAARLGLPWRARLFSPSRDSRMGLVRSESDGSSRVAFKREYYRWLRREASAADVVLLRYAVHDPWQLDYVMTAGKPVFTVHHTLEGPELSGKSGLGASARSIVEATLSRLTLRTVRGIVSVTPEIASYESRRAGGRQLATHHHPNGILFGGDVKAASDRRSRTVPEIVMVASRFETWHGLDLVLAGLGSVQRDFKLHLVGQLLPGQSQVVAADRRVVPHGVLSRTEIAQLLERSWMALGSFALYRKGMREACTLKVREYLRAGVPVAAGHADVFPEGWGFFRRTLPDMRLLLDHADEWRAQSRSSVSEAARPFIDKQVLLAKLYQAIAESL